MPDRHLTVELLRQVAEGEVEAHEVIRGLLDHLLALCPQCRRAWRQVAVPGRGRVAEPAYGAAFERALALARAREPDLLAERAAAPALVAELVQVEEAEQAFLLSTDPRFLTWGVCDLLINESHQAAFEDPAVAESLAKLAISLANRLDPSAYGVAFLSDVKAMAWAYLANARRVGSDLRNAEEALQTAEELLAGGTGDPLILAQVLNLKASLLRGQRRFEEFQQLLEEVIEIYHRAGDAHLEGRTLIQKADGYREEGKPAGAIPLLRRALTLIASDTDTRLVLCARHNLVYCLLESGRREEADALFRELAPLYGRFSDFSTHQRRSWLEGKLAAVAGRFDEAEAAFLEVRGGYVEREIGYDAALVSLDLAALYAAHGRMAEVRQLAEEMLPIFRSRDVHREALAALLVFQHAARTEAVTVQMVEQMATYLRRARRNPSLRFEEPS